MSWERYVKEKGPLSTYSTAIERFSSVVVRGGPHSLSKASEVKRIQGFTRNMATSTH